MEAACRAAGGLDYGSAEFTDGFLVRDPLLEGVVRTLEQEVRQGGPGGRLYAEQLMQSAGVHLVAKHTTGEYRFEESTGGGLPPGQLRRVREYVEAHLSKDIRLADLASEAAMSEYHFARLFKETTGESPYAYVVRRRLERAQEMLSGGGTALRVSDVAYALGYADPSHLTNQFKKRFGVTPSRFQREARR